MKKKTIIGITLLIALSIIVISFVVGCTKENKPNETNKIETEIMEETTAVEETTVVVPEETTTVLEETTAVETTEDATEETTVIEETTQVVVLKTNEEVAKEVIKGLWGNGKERIDKLTAAGYDVAAVQKIVDNTIISAPIKSPSYSAKNSKTTENSTPSYSAPAQSSGGAYLGNFKITGYYSGEGGVGQISATGMPLVPWGTCAMNRYRIKDLGLHYGDYIKVEGIGTFKIVDNGCSYNTVDVYVNSRSEAYNLTSNRNVYRA